MDVRAFLFQPLSGNSYTAELSATESGILAGAAYARSRAAEIGLHLEMFLPDGEKLTAGTSVIRLRGTAEQIARGEEELLACVGKPSGVATAAARFCALARGGILITCGAWKKVLPEVRRALREAIAIGGAGIRLVNEPFVYLDKNTVRMFADISSAVRTAGRIEGRTVAVQLRGDTGPIAEDARKAFAAGAGVLMVDTGNIEDLRAVCATACNEGFRDRIRIAFSGGVTEATLEEIIAAGADIVDVGRAIIDAPLLDFRLDVTARHRTSS